MYASIIDLVQLILRNALFVIGQSLFLLTFMFLTGGILFMIKGKKGA